MSSKQFDHLNKPLTHYLQACIQFKIPFETYILYILSTYFIHHSLHTIYPPKTKQILFFYFLPFHIFTKYLLLAPLLLPSKALTLPLPLSLPLSPSRCLTCALLSFDFFLYKLSPVYFF